jgi:hypothetical protein
MTRSPREAFAHRSAAGDSHGRDRIRKGVAELRDDPPNAPEG